MVCYVMVFAAVLHCMMLCYVMLWNGMEWYGMVWSGLLCCAMVCHVLLWCAGLCHVRFGEAHQQHQPETPNDTVASARLP